MYSIQRTYRGIKATAIPADRLPEDTAITFNLAVLSFGYLVPWNESITGQDWALLIERAFVDSPRVKEIVASIREAMPV